MTYVLMLTSTLPRHQGDHQANFVGEQAQAWIRARPADRITILAPHHLNAARSEQQGAIAIRRFRYVWPERWQALAYPAIMPNLGRNFALVWQVIPFLVCQFFAAFSVIRRAGASSAGPDLIYAHWVLPQGLVAWLLLKVTGTPYVLQNHSSDLSVLARLGPPGRAAARMIVRRSAHLFCVNADQRAAALALFRGDEQRRMLARITVLPMGIAPPSPNPPTAAPAAVGRPIDVGTIGRLSRKKGLDYLIGAAEILAARGIRPHIVIAGDGEDRARLEALVHRADVHFAGFVDGAAKAQFMADCRRFAFPAVVAGDDVEGMPVALLEALARGAPVLASRDTNLALLPEWPLIQSEVIMVDDPVNVAQLAGALQTLFERTPAPSASLVKTTGRYQWDRLIEEYLALIDQAIGQRSEAAPPPAP